MIQSLFCAAIAFFVLFVLVAIMGVAGVLLATNAVIAVACFVIAFILKISTDE